jgi:hypothetical protein
MLAGWKLAEVTPEVLEGEAVVICKLVFEQAKHEPQAVLVTISQKAAGAFYEVVAGMAGEAPAA